MRDLKEKSIKDKKETILLLTIKEYLDTGLPVGSKTLVEKYFLDVSPATVRNYLSEFEEEGYLIHLHTSSGRIPTEKGIKFYIDKIIEKMNVMSNLKIERDVQKSFAILGEDFIDLFLNKLSNLTNSISFFFYSVPKDEKILNLHLMNCSYGKILLIIALEDKVEEYIIKTDKEISDEELFNIKTQILKAIRENNFKYLDLIRKIYPEIIIEIERILKDRLKKREIGDIYIKGLKYILSYEDIKKSKDLETLIAFVEEKEKALNLVDFLTEFKNLLIIIGNEIRDLTLEKTVLIDLPYLKEDNVEAGLGFITPERFDFEYLFKILKQYANEIKEKLEKI